VRPDAAEQVGPLGHVGPGVAQFMELVILRVEVRPQLGAAFAEIGQRGDEPVGRHRAVRFVVDLRHRGLP
jgi:hypothetical protein